MLAAPPSEVVGSSQNQASAVGITARCCELQRTHHIVVGKNWGALRDSPSLGPAEAERRMALRRFWKERRCNDAVGVDTCGSDGHAPADAGCAAALLRAARSQTWLCSTLLPTGERWPSQAGQDVWALETLGLQREGFFVEVSYRCSHAPRVRARCRVQRRGDRARPEVCTCK